MGEVNLTLMGRASRYAEALPPRELRPWFDRVWMCKVSHDYQGQVVVVPDAAADLMWRGGRLCVAGPDRVAARPKLDGGSTIIGLRFAPGGAARWLGVALDEIVGREVVLGDLWARDAVEAAEQIGDGRTPREQRLRLQSLMARQATRFERPAREAGTIFSALGSTAVAQSKIARLGARMGVSERTLRRRCRELFGYGPKTLDRILRFRRFHHLAFADAQEDLAGLAARAGYFDQAHLSRDVRDLSGLTPAAFVGQLRAA